MWWWILFGIVIIGTNFIESLIIRLAIGAAFGIGSGIYFRFKRKQNR